MTKRAKPDETPPVEKRGPGRPRTALPDGDERASVVLSPETLKLIDAAAKEAKVSRSEWLRRALEGLVKTPESRALELVLDYASTLRLSPERLAELLAKRGQ